MFEPSILHWWIFITIIMITIVINCWVKFNRELMIIVCSNFLITNHKSWYLKLNKNFKLVVSQLMMISIWKHPHCQFEAALYKDDALHKTQFASSSECYKVYQLLIIISCPKLNLKQAEIKSC